MAKKQNNFVLLFEKIDSTKAYSVEEAVALAKETNFAKFDATVEVAYNLNIDVKKLTNKSVEQWYCQTVLGKTSRVLVSHVVQKLKKLKLLVQTLLVKTTLLLKSTTVGWTST